MFQSPRDWGMSTDYILIRLGVSRMVSIRRPPPRGKKVAGRLLPPIKIMESCHVTFEAAPAVTTQLNSQKRLARLENPDALKRDLKKNYDADSRQRERFYLGPSNPGTGNCERTCGKVAAVNLRNQPERSEG